MGMPEIISSNISREQSISDIIESVALEQTSLANLIDAEGKKIQKVLSLNSIDSILSINKSVNSTVNSITKLEMVLHSKLDIFKDCLCPHPTCDSCRCICIEQMRNVLQQIIIYYPTDNIEITTESGDSVSGRAHALLPGPDGNPSSGLLQLYDSQDKPQELVSICRIASFKVTSSVYDNRITYLSDTTNDCCDTVCANAINDSISVNDKILVKAGNKTVAEGKVQKNEVGMIVITVDDSDRDPVFVSSCLTEMIKHV